MSSRKTKKLKQHFAIIFGPLTKKIMVLVYRSILLVHFDYLMGVRQFNVNGCSKQNIFPMAI